MIARGRVRPNSNRAHSRSRRCTVAVSAVIRRMWTAVRAKGAAASLERVGCGRAWSLTAIVVASALLTPGLADAQIRFEDPSRNTAVTIGGWMQPRYEYAARHGQDDLSSFFLRRVRLDIRGHVVDERLTFRVMPELARTASMRDAWVNYAVSPGLQLRFGQFTVPFQWHRYVSARTLHFAERGLTSEIFGFPAGRDIGLMLHGVVPGRRVDYSVGVFDGAGQNVQRSNSAGLMASGRLTVAVLGALPREETDFRRSAEPGFSLGVGVQSATDNEVRPWDLGRSPGMDARADWTTGTADASLRWRGISFAADGYMRRVSPDDPLVARYTGSGYMANAGITLVQNALEAVGRFGDLRLDRDDPATRIREWGAGVNIYHRDHDSKTRIQYLNQSTFGPDALTTGFLIVEYHIQF